MSQAALNTRNHEEDVSSSRRSNGTRLAGIVFLLAVLCTVLVSGWMVLGWMEDAQRLPLSKMVVTGERHYTRNDDIRQAILALGSPGTFMTQDVNIIQSQIERLPWIKQASVRKQWPMN
jgi:cell division protein FtsQ